MARRQRIWSGIRGRLTALVIVAVIPGIVIAVIAGERHAKELTDRARKEASDTAALVSQQEHDLLDRTRQFLSLLTELPQIRGQDAAVCEDLLRAIHSEFPDYLNIGVADLKGNVWCSALPLEKPVDIEQRDYFKDALRTRDFSVGAYQVGYITHAPAINCGHPVFDGSGNSIVGVAYVAVDLEAVGRVSDNVLANLPRHTTITRIDKNGTVLGQWPQNSASSPSTRLPSAVVSEVLNKERGAVLATASNGRPYLYAYSAVRSRVWNTGMYVILAFPEQAVYGTARREMHEILFIVFLFAAFAVAVTWWGGNAFVVRWIDRLVAAAQGIRDGNYETRVDVQGGPKELRLLGESFNLMTEALHRRIGDLADARERLMMSESHLRALFASMSDVIAVIDSEGRYLDVPVTSGPTRPPGTEPIVGHRFHDIFPPEEADRYLEVVRRTLETGVTQHFDYRNDAGGDMSWFSARVSVVSPASVIWVARDITDRKRAEEELIRVHEIYRRSIANTRSVPCLFNSKRNAYEFVGEECERLFGVPAEKFTPDLFQSLVTEFTIADPEGLSDPGKYVQAFESGKIDRFRTDVHIRTPQGNQKWVACNAVPIRESDSGEVTGSLGIFTDITDRKRAEEAIREREERFQQVAENVREVFFLVDASTRRMLYINSAYEQLTGRSRDDLLGSTNSQFEAVHPDDLPAFREWEGKWLEKEAEAEFRLNRTDGQTRRVRVQSFPVRSPKGDIVRIAGIVEDVTERKLAAEQIQQQMNRLGALRAIDGAITASLDLQVVLHVVLEQITAQLGVDASDILLLNPHSLTLEFTQGRGFRTSALQHTHLAVGKGIAGRAALERKTIRIHRLGNEDEIIQQSPLLMDEDFISFVAVPLVAKGEVKGVLELFHRAPLSRDHDWDNFLQTLAVQAAIAIDNSSLFRDLQASKIELTAAYDITLEGWARALEIRDIETYDHTLRVTDITLKVSRTMGMTEKELMHVRRGAILHDIGKLGIPDAILHKPGPLSPEEWEIMRRHPEYAYNLLSPVVYLRPALKIPYCHHEKFDGTGYPQGLAEIAIPLEARVFAVADVRDALESDRPYRKAWPREKVRTHILEGSGTHFCPEVIACFQDLGIL